MTPPVIVKDPDGTPFAKVPLKEWEDMVLAYQEMAELMRYLPNLQRAFAEVDAIEAGKKPYITLDEFLESV